MKSKLKSLVELNKFTKRIILDPYVFLNYQRVHYKYKSLNLFSRDYGVVATKREIPIIVSMTTIPSRIKTVYLCIETLLRQSLKPDKIILWLSDDINKEDIPISLQRQERRGLSIQYCTNLKSYRKLVPTLRDFPNAIIVTADDDFFYPNNWLTDLVSSYLADPEYIHCYRAHYILKKGENILKTYKAWLFESPGIIEPSLNLLPTTGAGCLFPPNCLDEEVMNHEVFLKICPTADDIWFKAMSLRKGVRCKKVYKESKLFRAIKDTNQATLWSINSINNDKQAKLVFDQYDLYKKLD